MADVHAHGGAGALELADIVIETLLTEPSAFGPLYPLELGLAEKVQIVAREIYGADGVDFSAGALKNIQRLEGIGLKEVPVCIAKTQYSFSDDPSKRGRPSGFRISVREVTPSGGAGFVVVHTGDIMTMPGLPRKPAAENMKVFADGRIEGLF
jgi:formate--tetrahydrofolate ligase